MCIIAIKEGEKMKNRLKELRQKEELSQKEFAKAFNAFLINNNSVKDSNGNIKKISYATVSRWENEQTPIPSIYYESLVSFFGVTLQYLLGITTYYTKIDVVKVLNDNYLEQIHSVNIREILLEVFHFSADIPKPEKYFTNDEIIAFTKTVQNYWLKYFSFLTDHVMMQFIYKDTVSPMNNIVLVENIYDLLKDHIVLITETELSQNYEDTFQGDIDAFNSHMMYETRFGSKKRIYKLINDLIANAEKLKKNINNLPDNKAKERPINFLGERHFNNIEQMRKYLKEHNND